MRFKFHMCPGLSSLAWCAEIPARGKFVRVVHGPGVETADNWFVEGAWDGRFGSDDFMAATTLAGSGARFRANDALEFAGPSNPYRGLAVHRASDRLLISNSLPLLLVRSGGRPDPDNRNYYPELFRIFNLGFKSPAHALEFADQHRVGLVFHGNLLLDGNISASQKPSAPPPAGYEDYRDRLVAMLDRLRVNATDPQRSRTYRPLVTVSRGYDSVACAALGARAGWKDAVTLYKGEAGAAAHDDDGSPVAAQLGLAIKTFDVGAWRQRTDVPETDFIATGARGVMVRLAGMEEELRQRLLLLGNLGDRTWDPASKGVLPNWGRPRRRDQFTMGPESIWEYQLRTGFVAVYPAEFAAVHWKAMCRMMNSAEFRPWSIGGKYDRPLPRRLAEEMGVSRNLFGQTKMGNSHVCPMRSPSAHGRADYLEFLREIGRDAPKFTRSPTFTPFRFHWGMDRTMRRYADALSGAASSSAPASSSGRA